MARLGKGAAGANSTGERIEKGRRATARAAAFAVEQLESRWMLAIDAPSLLVANAAATPGAAPAVMLSWRDNSDNETSFKIERGTDGVTFTQIDTVGQDVRAYSDTSSLTSNVKYYYRVRAANSSEDSSYAAAADATGWDSANIGGVTGGSHGVSSGTVTVQTSGQAFSGTSDHFRFSFRSLTGDGTIIARVATLQNTSPWARAGVMIRDGTAANAKFVSMAITAGSGAEMGSRSTTGGNAYMPTYSGHAAPKWVKLVRAGTSFSGYVSADGASWTLVRTATVAMDTTVQVGLAASAAAYGTTGTSTYDNVEVEWKDHALPAGWASGDVGSTSGLAGSARYDAGAFNFAVEASGHNVGGTADTFHFAHRPLVGDGEVVARVVGMAGQDSSTPYAWAKAGVMFRAGTGDAAKNVFLAITGSQGAMWQYRTTTGGSTTETLSTGKAAPYYVKVKRVGDAFTGYTSADGTTWTQIGSSVTISGIGSSLNVGLALSAAGYGALNTTSFDNVKFTPSVPVLTAAAVHAHRVDLSWTDTSGSESGFVLQRSADGGTTWVQLPDTDEDITASGYLDTGVSPGVTYQYRVKAFIADAGVRGESAWHTVGSVATTGLGDGLSASYWAARDFSGTPVTRVDPEVSFHWAANQPPATGIPASPFTAEWRGQVKAPSTGTYTISTWSDDGVRVWVNGQLLIDHWNVHAPTEDTATISLTAGQKYDVRMEYFQNAGTGDVQLRWIRPGETAVEAIATQYLYSAVTLTAPAAPGSLQVKKPGPEEMDDVSATLLDDVPLTWTEASGASRYVVYRMGPSDTAWQERGSVVSTTLRFYDEVPTGGQRYRYKVAAVGAGGRTTVDVLDQPEDVSGFATPDYIRVEFDEVPDNVRHVEVRRSADYGVTWAPAQQVLRSASGYTDFNPIVPGRTYRIEVTNVTDNVRSAPVAFDVPAPTALPDEATDPLSPWLQARFYAGTRFAGAPVATMLMDKAQAYFGADNIGDLGIRSDDFSLTLSGYLRNLPASTGNVYRFKVKTDGGVRVRVDGQVVIDHWSDVPLVRGDADRNGVVGLNDLVILANNYGKPTGQTWADGDFDGNGSVGLNDLVQLSNNYGNPTAPDVVVGQIVLNPAVAHAVQIEYFNDAGTSLLDVQWATADGPFATLGAEESAHEDGDGDLPTGEQPKAPAWLRALVTGETAVSLDWAASASDPGALGVAQFLYEVLRKAPGDSTFKNIASLPKGTTSYVDHDVLPSYGEGGTGFEYVYKVESLLDGVRSSAGPTAAALTNFPAAPADLVATPASTSAITLTWADRSAGETGFDVESSADGVTFTSVATVAAGSTSYTVTGLSEGTRYHFRVRARNGIGTSAFTPVVSGATRLPAPVDLTKQATTASTVSLAWDDTSANESGFRVYRRVGSTGPWALVAAVGANVEAYVDQGLTTGVGYAYRVTAYNAATESEPSAIVPATPVPAGAPGTPGALEVEALTSYSVAVSWTQLGGDVDAFRVEWRNMGAGPDFALMTLPASARRAVIGGLTGGEAYEFRVTAVNSVSPSDAAYVQGRAKVPGITAFTAAPRWTGGVTLAYDPIAPTAERTISVERKAAGSTADWAEITAGTGSSDGLFIDATAAAGVAYLYRARRRFEIGTAEYLYSDPSATVGATGATDPSVSVGGVFPEPVVTAALAPNNARRIDVTWTWAHGPVEAFRVERKSSSQTVFVPLADVPGGSLVFRDLTADADETYTYRVGALLGSTPYEYDESNVVDTSPWPASTSSGAVAIYADGFESTGFASTSLSGVTRAWKHRPSTWDPQTGPEPVPVAVDLDDVDAESPKVNDAQTFVGELVNDELTLELGNLPSHTRVTVSFDLYVIGSWDGSPNEWFGPDLFEFEAAGKQYLQATFDNLPFNAQSYPGAYGQGPLYPSMSGGSSAELGYKFTYPSGERDANTVYRITRTIEHADAALALVFRAHGLQEPGSGGLLDEGWGIDNVDVTFPEGTGAGRVSGLVWSDANRNTRRDDVTPGAREPGVAGQTVYADLDRDGVWDTSEPSTVTAADGSYLLEALGPGPTLIRIDPTSGLTRGWHGTGVEVGVEAGEESAGVDFAVLSNQAPVFGTIASPTVTINPYGPTRTPLPQVAWQTGDVIVSYDSRVSRRFGADGTLKGIVPGEIEYAARFTTDGTLLGLVFSWSINQPIPGRVFQVKPDGSAPVVLIDRLPAPETVVQDLDGNLFVGVNGDLQWGVPKNVPNGIFQYDSTGRPINSWFLWNARVGSIDLAPDQHTLYANADLNVAGAVAGDEEETGWSHVIYRIDTNTGEVSVFAQGLTGAGQLRVLPDGRVLVADRDDIKLFAADGTLLHSFDEAGPNAWYSLAVDPDGKSFWAMDGIGPTGGWQMFNGSGGVVRFDLENLSVEGGVVIGRFDGVDQKWVGDQVVRELPRNIVVYGEAAGAVASVVSNHDLVYRVPASDPDRDPLKFTLTGQTWGAEIDPGTGELHWRPTTPGTYTFHVTVADKYGASASDSVTVNVVAATGENRAPEIQTDSLSRGVGGMRYQGHVWATDANGDRLTYALVDTPGVTIGAGTGMISFVPTSADVAAGGRYVTVRATDARGASDQRSYWIDVSTASVDPGIWSALDDVMYVEVGQKAEVRLTAARDYDEYHYRSGELPPGAVLERRGPAEYVLVWQPTAEQLGSVDVKLGMSMAGGALYSERTFRFVVVDRIVASPRVLVVRSGDSVDISATAYQRDAAGALVRVPVDGPITVSAAGGQGTSFGAITTGPDGQAVYVAGSSVGGVEVLRVGFNALSGSVNLAHDEVQIVVVPAAASTAQWVGTVATGLSATQGTALSLTGVGAPWYVGTYFADSDADAAGAYEVEIDWGDDLGPQPGYLVAETDPSIPEEIRARLFHVAGSHTYALPGAYTVTITVTDPDGPPEHVFGSGSQPAVTVAGAAADLSLLGISATAGLVHNDVVGSFVDTVSASTVEDDFRVEIEWGDGTRSTALLDKLSSGRFEIRGVHTYSGAVSSGVAKVSVYQVRPGGAEYLRQAGLMPFAVGGAALPAPTAVQASPVSTTQVEVRWAGVAGATGYVVRRFNPDGSIQDYELESAAARSFDVGGLSAALRYGFQVLARDAGFALSVPSATVYASPAGEPTRGEYVASSVRARAVAIDAIRVTWSPPTDFDPVAVAGWDVLRATSAGGPFASILPDNQIVDALDVGYEDEGVAPGQQYWYKVVAVDDQGVQYTPSAAVEARAGVPAAPTGLVAGYAGAYAEGDRLVKRVGLRWSAVPSGVALLGYDVYRGTTPDFSLSPTNLIGTSATARYTDDIDVTGQPTGHTYYYAVRAVYAGYDGAETSSAPSARVAVPTGADPMTKPAAPSNLAAVEVTSARVTLAWTDQALDEAGFDVFRREHDALAPQPWGTPIGRLTADATTFVDETVDAGVAYEYEVRPHNKAGRRGDIGGTGDAVPSVVVTVSASPAAPPAAPTGLSFSSRTTDRIALTWTGPAGSPAATGYHVYRKTAEGGFVRLTANPIAATTLTDGGLRAGTTYTYRVVALSAGGGRSQALQGDLATLTAPDVRPSVRIVSPGDFSGIQLDPLRGNTVDTRIRKVTTVAVIVDDPNFLGNGDPADAARSPRWELRLVRLGTDGSAAPGQGEGVLLAAGHGSVGSPAGATGGSVYQLDPSQFPDGQYRLSLRARDEKGAGAPAAVTVSLFSNNKFGNLVLPTTDLQFDIPGRSPLVVRRVYDSSRANERLDFGYGWRLEATQSLVQTTARRDASTGGSVFREGDLVYVDVPGQGRHVFQFLPVPNNYGATNPSPYFGYTNYWAQFVAVDGSNATLSVPGDINAPESARLDLIRNPDGGGYVALGLDLKSSGTYDPASIKFGNEYVVKSADGTRHSIRASTGRLQRSTDANGNVTTGGVDAGTFSVEFDRLAWTNGAAAGLIGAVRIVDKAGNQVGEQFNYAYDEVKGNLISTTYDGRTTRYRYADPAAGREHFLTSVVDPRNVVMLRAAYDDAGRLASLTDATGKAVSVGTTTSDGATGGEAVVDPTADANQTENIYDDHGNVIRQIRTVRSGGVLTGYHVTVFAYDYHAGDLTSELSELFDADALSAARSQQNALVAMREYAPFTVPAADRDQRYTRAPGRVQRETTFHGANGGLAAKLPHKQIEQPDDNTRRVTTFSEYSPLGKPGRVTSELFKTVPDGDDEDALPDWVAVTTMIARSLYDTSGNLRFQIDEDGAGTEYIYTLNQPGLPNGLLTHTYRVTGLPKADEALTGIPAVNTYTRVRLSATAYFTTTNATTGAFAGQVHWTEGAENSRTTFYWYDDRGRVIRTYFAAEEGGQDVWVSSETLYDGERIRDTFEQWYVDDGDHVLDLADQGGDSAIFTSSTPPHSTTTFYDALGRVKEVSSFEGTTTNTYDIDGNLIQVAHPDGTYTRTVYDDMGRVVWQTDRFRSILSSRPAGLTNATRTLYDALGRAVRTERYTNVHVDFVAEDRPVAVDGGTVSDLMRTKLGSVAALAAELNQEHLDPDPPLVLPPTVLLAAEETVYDGAGRVVETARLLGTATHPYLRAGTVYDDAGRVLHAGVLRITAPAAAARGFVFTTGDFESFTTYAPDRAGGVTPGSGIVNRVTTGQVNNAGGRVNETRTDARGRAWRTYFDDDTNPLDSTDDRSFTEVLYGVGDQEHGTYALPPRQDGEEASVPAGGRHEVRLAQRRPGETPAVTHYVYDALGRLTDVWLPPVDDASTTPTTPVAPHWHYVYDADGNQTEQTDPNGHTTEFGYDSRGRRVSRTLPGNQTETWQYDFRGRLRVHVDFKGQATFYDFDDTARGRLRGEYRYATAGAVPATGDPASVPWDERSMYEYDDDGAGLGRIVKVTTWDRHPVSGDPRKVQWEQTAFDPITGNVVRETVRRPGADPNLPDTLSDVRHVYDAGTGLLVETSTFVTDGNAVETISSRTLYGYDRQGRLASVTSAKVAGQTPAAPAVRRARYGPAGQIAAGAAGNALPTTTYQYDPAGNLWKVNLPNGVVTTYAYDRVGRLTGVVTVDMEGDKLFEQNYELESDGQRDLVVEKRYDGANATPFSTVTVDWAYDAAGRLTGETRDGGTTMTASTPNNAGDYVDTYGYDLNGNRRTKSHVFHTGSAVQTDRTAYAYDTAGNDRLVAEGPDVEPDGIPDVATRTTYAYDANGSTTSKTTGSDVTKYLYDLRNKLVGLSANDDTDATDSGDTQYVYDASGNRIERVEHGASSDTTTIFVNDTANPIGHAQVVEERSSATAATPTVTYVVGGDVLGQARAATAISGAAPALEYLLYDGHGSTRGLLSAAGAIATGVAASDQVYDYDAFGIALSSNPASVLTTLLYSGEQLDSGLGMQYLRSRFYNQAVGRFFSFDSFQANPQDPSKLHKYAYVANDPIGMIDPSGYVGIVDTLVTKALRTIFVVGPIVAGANYFVRKLLAPSKLNTPVARITAPPAWATATSQMSNADADLADSVDPLVNCQDWALNASINFGFPYVSWPTAAMGRNGWKSVIGDPAQFGAGLDAYFTGSGTGYRVNLGHTPPPGWHNIAVYSRYNFYKDSNSDSAFFDRGTYDFHYATQDSVGEWTSKENTDPVRYIPGPHHLDRNEWWGWSTLVGLWCVKGPPRTHIPNLLLEK